MLKLKRPKKFGAVLGAQALYTTLTAQASNGTLPPVGVRELIGWALTSPTSAAAHVRLRDGNQLGAPVIAAFQYVAGGDSVRWFGDQAVIVKSGQLYLEVVAGTIEGAIYYA